MKRCLFLIIGLLALIQCNAFAQSTSQSTDTRTATIGDKDNSLNYRMATYRDGNNDGYLVYAVDTGIQYPYLESTTNLTLAYYQSGIVLAVYPSANHTQIKLPTATPGLDFYMVDGLAGDTWSIEIQSTDQILFTGDGVRGTGITNSSAAAGDQIELFCQNAGQWLVKDKLGTWAAGS